MIVNNFRLDDSPARNGCLRLSASVAYQDGLKEEYWFEVDHKHEYEISDSGNPWLAFLLPVAVNLNEPLYIERHLDRVLRENAEELMAIWQTWYPHANQVFIKAPLDSSEARLPTRSVAFFSGGIDAFFTVLHSDAKAAERGCGAIDDLLTVWGFDVPLSNPEAFRRMVDSLGSATAALGKELVTVTTNLRSQSRFGATSWGRMAHGGALAATALVLEKRFHRALIGSSDHYLHLLPWGSHPLTDPLFSTAHTRFSNYGGAFTRLEKTRFVAQSPVALKSLRVCWQSGSDENCCKCTKCIRTMIILDLLNSLDCCETFAKKTISKKEMRRLYIPRGTYTDYIRDIINLAKEMRRPDVAKALMGALRYSRFVNKCMPMLTKLKGRWPFWRAAGAIERLLFHSLIK